MGQQHGLDGPVADAVQRQLHILPVALLHELVQSVLGQEDLSPVVRPVRVGCRQGGAVAGQGAVHHNIAAHPAQPQLPDLRQVHGLIEQRHIHRKLAAVGVDELRVPVVEQPAALDGRHGGDAVFQQPGHGQMDGLHAELIRQAPQHIGAQHIVGVPPENARGQAAAVQLHALQGEGHLIIQQGVGVQHADVVLLGEQHHRTVAAILVQHIPVRKTLFLELRLLHLAAQHRALPLFGGGQHLAQLPVGPRAAQIHAHHVHGGLHHMEVVVDKPRQHRAAPGVDDLRAGAHQLLPIIAAACGADHFPRRGHPVGPAVAAHGHAAPVFNDDIRVHSVPSSC